MNDILDNPDKPWDWEGISMIQNLTMDFINANRNEDWNWILISDNPNITMKDILDNVSTAQLCALLRGDATEQTLRQCLSRTKEN